MGERFESEFELIEVEEGERHPSEGQREIEATLKRIEHLLREILERTPRPTFPQPTALSVTVRS